MIYTQKLFFEINCDKLWAMAQVEGSGEWRFKSPHPLVTVNPGEKFGFQPHLDQSLHTQIEEEMVDILDFEVSGIGRGQVWLKKIHVDLETTAGYYTPAGDVEPYKFELQMRSMTPEKLASTRALLVYGEDDVYIGKNDFDETEIYNDGVATLYIWNWKPADENDDEEAGDVIFPPNIDFSDIKFAIEDKNTLKVSDIHQ